MEIHHSGIASAVCSVCVCMKLRFLKAGNSIRNTEADRHNKKQYVLNGNIYIHKDMQESHRMTY